MNTTEIKRLAEEYEDYVIRMRREFHRYPEVSGQEVHTREVLIRELDRMEVPYRLLEGTGIIAVIQGKKEGKHRVLRADIDALPVQEEKENLAQAKACVSGIDGVCHACGHDAHMAMLLGTMRVLLQMQDELEGTVYCCFEEGEETNCGVEAMLKALEEYPIDECFALHVYNNLEAGKISLSAGPRMSGTIGIDFYVKGKAGHGSRPDQAVNPIVPAAHILTQIDSAFVNQIDAEETVTLGICMFQAGEANNVFPESAYIGGTARFFNNEEGVKALEIINRIAENTAVCHRSAVEYGPLHKIRLWPVINDAGVAGRVQDAVAEICGAEVLGDCSRWYGSECYSRYLERYPGMLGMLGIRSEAYGSGAPHHNGKFDLDESALVLGVCAEVGFVFS